ncbi:hypothetical protein MQY53_001597 [Salmonella enterica subsp. enterica]|nr:hypothetical protein [Salmonella enterica subsp. enterica]
MSAFHIDFSDLDKIRESAGATKSQMIGAFNRALKRTAAKLKRESVAMMIVEVGIKDKSKKRVKSFVENAGNEGVNPGTGKIWFGLDDVQVSGLKGRMKYPPGIPLEDRKRDSRGRFVRENGPRGATFIPASKNLHPTTFLNSFVGTVRRRESIWIRSGCGHVNEARLPIYKPMLSGVEAISEEAGKMLMKYYEQDLRGRVAGGVK